MICTEYIGSTEQQSFRKYHAVLKRNNVGAINWGFVSGKTNTIFAWSDPRPTKKEPTVWFHDIYRQTKHLLTQRKLNLSKK
jgi:hypothetical protein